MPNRIYFGSDTGTAEIFHSLGVGQAGGVSVADLAEMVTAAQAQGAADSTLNNPFGGNGGGA